MLFLLGAILFSSWLTIAFKIADRFGISTFQAIIFNYFTCVFTGLLFDGKIRSIGIIMHAEWFPWAILMGTMFVSVFNLVAYTTRQSGLAIVSVASKLSLVIPFLFSVFLFNESISSLKIAGIILALVAVFLTCLPVAGADRQRSKKTGLLLLPFILFLGSGLQDSLIKFVEANFINESNNNQYIVTAFAVAGIVGSLILLWFFINGKERFDLRAVIAGVIIGIPNYFSLWCLVNVLKLHAGNSSSIIPITNMGIVLFSTLVAALFFREHLSKMNWLGIILAMAAISMIAFG